MISKLWLGLKEDSIWKKEYVDDIVAKINEIIEVVNEEKK